MAAIVAMAVAVGVVMAAATSEAICSEDMAANLAQPAAAQQQRHHMVGGVLVVARRQPRAAPRCGCPS